MPLRRPKDSGGRVTQGTNALVRALFMVAVSALLLVRAVPASAQEQGLGGSFITPFPDNDVYQVQVVGDWLAEGLLTGLVEAFTAGPGVSISRKRLILPVISGPQSL